MNDGNLKLERKRLIISAVIPLIFLILCWLIKLTELSLDINLANYSIYPRNWKSLYGIILMPFLHGDIAHLAANTATFLILSTGIFYFYKDIALKVWGFAWVFTGLLTWIIGRESYHIGASGIIYAFAGFLFLSGVLRNYTRLMALSLLIVFLYGGMFWGVFPTQPNISWEGHLSGLIVGIVLAIIYRKQGPQREKYSWEIESDEDDPQSSSYGNKTFEIQYHYTSSEHKDEENDAENEGEN